jgi:peptide deformylase
MPDEPLLPIRIVPDPVLRQKAKPVTRADAERVRALAAQMLATMYAAPGIGLAAPQVGVPLRLVVLDLQREESRGPMVLVNPEILAVSDDTSLREEGCLSLPGQYADVERPERIRLRWHDLEGARHEREAEGLLAVCLQHELDHLDGVLFVDHLSVLKRNMILRKLAKEQKAKARA